MNLPGPPIPQRHLQPGELFVTQEPQWVITILGSCVAVTMFSARARLAAICHALLPQPGGKEVWRPPSAECLRYVSHALPTMAERFLRSGLEPKDVEVKIFAGGNVLASSNPHDERSIGNANVRAARKLLEAARFRIKAHSVGGDRGCKIVFNTYSGEVLHKPLPMASPRR
jgi:chemotaxis protein CheD